MSIEVISQVFKRYPAGGNEGMLALALADHAHDDGTNIWPSVAHLATKTKMDQRTVQRYLRKMEESTWLIKVKSATGRTGDTNNYVINPDWLAGKNFPLRGGNLSPLPVDKVIHTGDTTCVRGDTTCVRGDTVVSPESSITVNNRITPTPFKKGEDGFEEFAAEYPRRLGMRRARKEWSRIKPDMQLRGDMAQALRAWKMSPEWQRERGQYVPGLAKWLIDKRWLDAPGASSIVTPASSGPVPAAKAVPMPPEIRERINAILGRQAQPGAAA